MKTPTLRQAAPLFLGAALFVFSGTGAWAAEVPAGTLITGSASGAATGLLGLDSGFTPGPGSNVTALDAADLEFLTDDYAVGVDFFADGLVRVYDNGGTGLISGSYTLTFDFAALPSGFSSFALADVSTLSGGSVTATWLNAHAVQLSLNDAAFTAPFASFTAQIGTATAVPEPGSLALAIAALALMAGASRCIVRGCQA